MPVWGGGGFVEGGEWQFECGITGVIVEDAVEKVRDMGMVDRYMDSQGEVACI